MPIMPVSDATFEEKRSDNRVFVRSRVNRAPEQSWINTFKSHASTSVLRAASTIFNGNDLTLELVRPKSRSELTTALDCFIEWRELGLLTCGVEPSPASSRRCEAGSSADRISQKFWGDRMTRSCRVVDDLWHRLRCRGAVQEGDKSSLCQF